MIWLLDTNVLIRYFVGTPPEQAQRAAALIDGDEDLLVAPIVLAEVAYGLRRFYGVTREESVDCLLRLVQRSNIRVTNVDRAIAIEALQRCQPSARVNLVDALLWAEARSHTPAGVYSFDQQFPSEGIEVREP